MCIGACKIKMAFLYRRDLDILGYDIKIKEIKARRVLSTVAYSELITENQMIPCVATFFKFTKGVRVEYINDKKTENRIMDGYMVLLREHPKLLFECVARLLIRDVVSIPWLISIIYLLYVLTFKVSPLSIEVFIQIYRIIICVILVSIVRYLMDII